MQQADSPACRRRLRQGRIIPEAQHVPLRLGFAQERAPHERAERPVPDALLVWC